MRGGAQAHLIEAADGHFYVVKFRNNPQHRRILINERIASAFLDFLEISTPPTALVRLSPEFLEDNPDVYLQLGTHRLEVSPGWHFGSRYPGDPARTAVYDFVPDALLEKVMNLPDFLGVFVFDKWTGNADARQSIFFRARLREPTGPHALP
ncbi:MAG: HipA family kinase, partial [Pseudomonadota bacterium]